jgi:Zn-dependent peptidase ImmA (M78 family)
LLKTLRALVPNRELTATEAYTLMESQASVLRRQLGIVSPEFPEEAIGLIPRVKVIEIDGLPSSGVSKWHNGTWVIAINLNECWQRQRFTTIHELGHIIAFGNEDRLLAHSSNPTVRREQLAEYFAGCLLMPAIHVRRLVAQGYGPDDLADLFGVSLRAVEVRLSQVQAKHRPRCDRAPGAATILKDWKYSCPPAGLSEVAA